MTASTGGEPSPEEAAGSEADTNRVATTGTEGYVSCPYCGESVPPGAFCGYCGAHLNDPRGHRRLHHFAANPTEHVVRASVISTLLPHLPRRHAHLFRETFVGGALVVVLLAALRLYTPALVLAAALLPVLYLLYMHEAEVWEQNPLGVLAATFGAGALLGVGYSLGFGHVVTASLQGTQQGPLFSGVLLPVVAQLCMLAGPLAVLGLRRYDEALDGLSFGVFSALGFTLGSVVAGYWHSLAAPLVGAAGISTDQIANIVRTGIIAGIVGACTTGLVTTSLWLSRHRRARGLHASWPRIPATAVVVAFAVQIGLGLASYFLTSLLLVVIVWAIAAASLLVALRVVTHLALLEEGTAHVVGPPSSCPECHLVVPTMHFCPHCGTARSAAPKHTRVVPEPA